MIGLLRTDAGDAADLSSSTGWLTGDLVIDQILTRVPFNRTRSTGLTPVIVADLGEPKPIRIVWLGYTNATSDATWRIRGADSEANLTAAPTYDSATVSIWPPVRSLSDWDRRHGYLLLDAPTLLRWWRIDITQGSAESYFDCGRLIMGDPWVPSRGMDFGSTLGCNDESTRSRSIGAISYPRRMGVWRDATFRLSALSKAELFDYAAVIDRQVGTSSEILALLDLEEWEYHHENTLYGLLTGLQPIINRTRGIYRKSYRFEETEHP